jgi:DNA (cytosine-5)-methyltransferase 1
VFVIGCLGDPASAAAVLFERHSLQGNSAPSRQKGQRLADTLTVGANQCSGFIGDITDDKWPAEVAPTINAHFGNKMGLENQHINGGAGLFVPDTQGATHAFKVRGGCDGGGKGYLGSDEVAFTISTHQDQHIFQETKPNEDLICFEANMSMQAPAVGDLHPTITRRTHAAIAFPINTQIGLRGADTSNSKREGLGLGNEGDPSFTLQAAHSHAVATQSAVRRLTPRECERLQGFPDDYTLTPHRNKPMADGPRYKALGNSMAVPVMHWIGKRIQMVEDIK